MPRVLSVFEFAGCIDGFGVELDSLTLTIVDGGLLLGRASCREHEVALIDGKANLDLFESTDEHKVYSCRFSLVKVHGDEATIIDGAARVSKAHGLVGRWNAHGELGRTGVCDHAFELKLLREVDRSVTKQETGEDIHTVSIAAADGATVAASDGETSELLLRGDAVDQNGSVYRTTLEATLHADGSVSGVSTELGRQCNIVGSWSDNNISYTLDFPIDGTITQYSYRGVLTTGVDGRETLSGTWKYELKTEGDDELFGGFSFVSLKNAAINIEEFLPGQYVFTGSATSDGGTTYDSKLTLTLATNGTLTGKSEELSIAPQTCELQGSWDRADRMITYRMTYTNGATGSYEYVGKLLGQQFIGRWVNPRAADRVSERGNFLFSLTSFEASDKANVESSLKAPVRVSTEDIAAKKTDRVPAGDVAAPLVAGTYSLTGSATSDGGTKYDSKLTLHLAADGSLVGESEELSIAPQVCKLEGSWNAAEKTISYNLIYTNGCTAAYEYVGRVENNKLAGRWTNARVKDCEAERGAFEFEITSFAAAG